MVYSLTPQTQSAHGHVFSIRSSTGDVMVRGVVDREKTSVYQLTVVAHDQGPDPLSSETNVLVYVDDVNDNAPLVTIHTLTGSGRLTRAHIVISLRS